MIEASRTRERDGPTEPVAGPQARLALLLAGSIEIGLLGLLAWWPGLPFPLPGFAFLALALAAYAMGAFAVRGGAGTLAGVWIAGIAMRLVLLPAPPELSADVWRALWDGHVQLHGINPYEHPPSAPELVPIRTEWFSHIENPDNLTGNPPLAQLAFVLVAWTGTGVFGLKVLWVVLDLAAAWLLVWAARLRGRGRRVTLLLYLWSPLLLVETAWNGHMEPLGLVGLAAVLAAVRRPGQAGIGLAWAGLVRGAPWAIVPALVRRHGAPLVITILGMTTVCLLPYADTGLRMLEALGMHGWQRTLNEGMFGVVAWLLRDPVAARWAAGVLVLAAGAWASWRGLSTERTLLMVVGSALVLSPSLTPAYALWILPVAALGRRRSWILLTGTAFAGYWGVWTYQATGVWPQPLWSRLLLWGPPLLLLFLEAAARLGETLQERRESESTLA